MVRDRQRQPGFGKHGLGVVYENCEMRQAADAVHKKINAKPDTQQRMREREIPAWLRIGIHPAK